MNEEINNANVRNSQFRDQFLQVTFGPFLSQDFEHFLADVSHLAGLGITCGLGILVGLLLGESNGEDSQNISICGSDIHECFDESLPFSNQGAEFVASHVHSVEVGDHVGSLNIFAHESDLAIPHALIPTVEIGKVKFKDTSLQTLRSNFCETDMKK